MIRLLSGVTRLLGFGMVALGLYLGLNWELKLTKGDWVHWPSIALIGLILIGLVLISHQLSKLYGLMLTLIQESPSGLEKQLRAVQPRLRELGELFYRSGASALARELNFKSIPAAWGPLVLQLEAQVPFEDVRMLLQQEAREKDDRLGDLIHMVASLTSLAPSVGMVGTVLGLVKLLGDLQDLSALGPNMALALLSTFYGLVAGVVMLSPIVSRLESLRNLQTRGYEQALFWLHLIENRKPLLYVDPRESSA